MLYCVLTQKKDNNTINKCPFIANYFISVLKSTFSLVKTWSCVIH